ncbi:MAG: ABC transporter ATP-binding protein [Bacteroidota bacterium]
MISTENLCRTFIKNASQAVKAVDDVSLRIRSGEFVAIIGASGSGKSTLMNMLGLLDSPDSGNYYLCGRKVSDMTLDELASIRNRKIGFIFQQFHLMPESTAKENVEIPLIYSDRTDIKDLAARALEQVGLGERGEHLPKELSGGQQQRVAIARALVNEPELILADEPTGNLDSKSAMEIMEIFGRLNKEGKTIVLITHDGHVAGCAKRIISISDGKIVSDSADNIGSSEDIILNKTAGED